jgi:hypothetical protein
VAAARWKGAATVVGDRRSERASRRPGRMCIVWALVWGFFFSGVCLVSMAFLEGRKAANQRMKYRIMFWIVTKRVCGECFVQP